MIAPDKALLVLGRLLLLISFAMAVRAAHTYVRLDIPGVLDDLSGRRRERGMREMTAAHRGHPRRLGHLSEELSAERGERLHTAPDVADEAAQTCLYATTLVAERPAGTHAAARIRPGTSSTREGLRA